MKLNRNILKLVAGFTMLSMGFLYASHGQGFSDPSEDEFDEMDDENTYTLSPFEVQTSEFSGYRVTESLAGSRVRTDLKDIGSAISVITDQFLKDTKSNSAEDLLVYTVSTEVAGQDGNFVGGGDDVYISSGYNSPVTSTRVRGLAQADNLRDFFLTDIPWDSYNTGRVDIQRGPNAILFGIGSPAGIINNSVDGAAFNDTNKVNAELGSFGSYRGSIALNREILKDELAFRISGLYNEQKYRQKPAHKSDHRLFGALRWDPKIFKKGGAHTVFKANFESGDIDGIRPNATPPLDAITPWFTDMENATYPWDDSEWLISSDMIAQNPWLGTAATRVFAGLVAQFADPNTSADQSYLFQGDTIGNPSPEVENSGRYLGINLFNTYARNAQLPGYAIGPYKPKSLTDRSVFDFYNNLMDGKNKRNWSKFDAYNLNLSQTFLDQRIGFELAYDNQVVDWGYTNFIHDGTGAITIDVMETFMDGSPNPNVGRAMYVGSGQASSGATERERESVRATVYGEVEFRDIMKDSILGSILGQHRFTASQMRQSIWRNFQRWDNYFIDESYLPSSNEGQGTAGRDVLMFAYLSDDLRGVGNSAGLNLPRIRNVLVPRSGQVIQYDPGIDNYRAWDVKVVRSADYGYEDRPYTDAGKHLDVIESSVFVWQGYFFEENIVTTFGWRRDIASSYDAGTPDKVKGRVSVFNDPDWRLPTGQADASDGRTYNSEDGETRSYSVVAHVPDSFSEKYLGGIGMSAFYNESSNFQPDASRIDVVGNILPSPTGKTKDYGVMLRFLDGRVSFKVNRYRTSVSDQTFSSEMTGAWAIGYMEAWGQQFATDPNDANYGITSENSRYGAGHILQWQPAHQGNHVVPGDFSSAFTQEAIDAQFDIQRTAEEDWFSPENQIPSTMQAAWGMNDYATGGGSVSNPFVNLTGDTVSEGTEFELYVNPIEGLDIMINASKTDAKRTSLAKSFEDWVAKRTEDLKGPMGDIRFWGAGNWVLTPGSTSTARGLWNNTVLPGYELTKSLNNASVPELRPWRFNATANYSFRDGRLAGLFVGGSYRWEDKRVIGFALNEYNDGYDVNQPYHGSTNESVDFWLGYQKSLDGFVKNWRVQLNVRNAFASDRLIPITVQPDGTPAAMQIPAPRVITLSSTFEF